MADNRLFYVGVKGLIQNQEGKYLLFLADVTTHSKNIEPYWDIPGGRMKDSETFEQTLQREIREETGIDSFNNAQMLTTVLSNHSIPYGLGGMAGLVLVVFRVEVPDGIDVLLSDEHSEYAWVDTVEAKKRLEQKYPQEFLNLLEDIAKLA